jgi:hypothetical protein
VNEKPRQQLLLLRQIRDESVRVATSDGGSSGDSFEGPLGQIDDLGLPAMSVEGMLAMKVQYASLRNGAPPRPKDLLDIEVLRGLL